MRLDQRRTSRQCGRSGRALGTQPPMGTQPPTCLQPRQKSQATLAVSGATSNGTKPYSWSLSDIIEQRLFRFLFSEEDVYEPNFGGLVGELEEWLTSETAAGPKLRTTSDAPQTFQELLDWFKKNKAEKDFFGDAHAGTKGKLLRRLKYIVQEGDGVLRRIEPKGNPLVIPAAGVDGPIVIDLFALNGTPSLQRFVVAAVLHQNHRVSIRQAGQRAALPHHAGRAESLRAEGRHGPHHAAGRAGRGRDALAGRDPVWRSAAGEPGVAACDRKRCGSCGRTERDAGTGPGRMAVPRPVGAVGCGSTSTGREAAVSAEFPRADAGEDSLPAIRPE